MIAELPPNAPRKGNHCTRAIGRALMRMLGWKMDGALPNCPKLIIAAAPHTSNWDFIIAMIAVLSIGLKASYLMKKEAFFWPFAGLFKWLGGVPVARTQAGGLVESLTEWFSTHEKAWLLITPEGTRSRVERYKTGFLRVAEEASVPVMLVSWDYPSKRLVLEKIWTLTGDHDADCDAIRRYLNNRYIAKVPEWQ